MRIIPVMDIMRGEVVHAIAGEREKYKPVKSVLVESSDPLTISMAFRNLGFKELYIADLDAIRSTGNNLDSISRIATETGIELMVDAGFRTADEASDYIESGTKKIVLATESLRSIGEISKVIETYRIPVIGSIDIKSGHVVASSRCMRLPVEELIRRFESEGVSEIIFLDLDRVGTNSGPNFEFLEKVLSRRHKISVLVGGGVRNEADIVSLGRLGVAGVLIATALHKGIIVHPIEL